MIDQNSDQNFTYRRCCALSWGCWCLDALVSPRERGSGVDLRSGDGLGGSTCNLSSSLGGTCLLAANGGRATGSTRTTGASSGLAHGLAGLVVLVRGLAVILLGGVVPATRTGCAPRRAQRLGGLLLGLLGGLLGGLLLMVLVRAVRAVRMVLVRAGPLVGLVLAVVLRTRGCRHGCRHDER